MKKLLVAASLLILTCAVHAQSRKDNAIIIHDTSISVESITRSLLRSGFDIECGNNGYVKTSFKSNSSNAASNRLTFFFDGDSIIARAWLKLDLQLGGVRAADPDLAEYRTMKGNLLGDTFDMLTAFVKKITTKYYFIKLSE